MRDDGAVVAVTGAAGELGRELREAAAERGFPVAEWRLYDTVEAIAELADEIDEEAFSLLEQADFDGVDLVFLCGDRAASDELAARAGEAGAVAIDLVQGFAGREDVPHVVPAVNSEQVELALEAGVVACPVATAVALSTVLNPLDAAAVLRRISVTVLDSVSSAGRPGVEELARQTLDLLGGRDPVPTLWPQRIAFNVISQVGEVLTNGATGAEWEAERQTRRLLDLPDLPVTISVVRIPVFYGLGLVVNVETEQPIDSESARDVLRQAPGVLLHEGASGAASAPALAEAVGTEATHVGRVREDPTVPYGLSLWVAFDGVRAGGAINAVQIGECLLREIESRR